MKILIINTLYSPFKVGGAEVSVQLLAEGLAKYGYEVHVASLVPKSSVYANTVAQLNGVNVHYIPLVNIYWPFDGIQKATFVKAIWHLLDTYNPFMIKKVKNLVENINPDIIHTNNLAGFSAGLLSYLGKTDSKIIHTARDYYFLHPNCTLMKDNREMGANDLEVRFWSFLRAPYLKHIHSFIGISKYVLNQYKVMGYKLGSHNIVIYNPVCAVENFKSKGRSGRIKVGYIGRLSNEKGFDKFLQLSNELSPNNPNVQFLAAGKGEPEYLDMLKTRFTFDNVEVLGYVESSFFYSEIDILVSPIRWQEPFGRTIVEALSFGVHVIGFGKGGASEIFDLLYPNGKAQTYSQLKDKIIAHINSESDCNIKLYNIDLFSLDNHINKVLTVYKS